MYKVMIVEDDSIIASALQKEIKKWGLESFYVKDFTDITEQFVREKPHLILLDITLPYYNGYYWCGEIRKLSNVPIIFISSNTENMDIIMAMNMGGDDFITKPFDLPVVIAKLQAVLRRTYSYQGESSMMEHRGLILNLGENTLYYNEERIELTKNEFRILKTLMEQSGNVVSRERLMQTLWDDECFVDDNTLTVNVTRLRKKLKESKVQVEIETKKGAGYRLE